MIWKMVLLPLLSLVMLIVNVVQLSTQLSQTGAGSPVGAVLMTLVWLALLVFSLRFAISRIKESRAEQQEKKKE